MSENQIPEDLIEHPLISEISNAIRATTGGEREWELTSVTKNKDDTYEVIFFVEGNKKTILLDSKGGFIE